MEITTLSIVVGIIVGVMTIVGAVSGFFKWLRAAVKRALAGGNSYLLDVPKKTLVILPKAQPNSCCWHMGAVANRPAMQITGRYTVTNITKLGIMPTVARLKKPPTLGHVMVQDTDSNLHGSFHVPPGATTDLSFDFWVVPPVRREGEPFTVDVCIIDQFGNAHWLRRIQFSYF